MLELPLLALCFFGGIAAAFINTLASHGSLITLPLLMTAGLPAPVANATNRVGVTAQALGAVLNYRRSQTVSLGRKEALGIIAPVILGSLAGGLLAVDLSAKTMEIVILVLMLVMLGVVLVPKPKLEKTFQSPWLQGVVFFGIGLYGGFIQAGVSLLILYATQMFTSMEYVKGNGLKVLIVLLFSVPSVALFQYHGLIHWPAAVALAGGQFLGGWIGAKASQVDWVGRWVPRLLPVIIALSALKSAWDLGLF